MDYIEILKKFVSGEMAIGEFEKIYFSNKDLQQLLQEKLPEIMLRNAEVQLSDNNINNVLYESNWKTKHGQYSIQCFIEQWLECNNIKCAVTPKYEDEFMFLISVMPDCINGEKAEELVDEIIQSIPENIGKTKRKKEIKEKIKEAFHIKEGKRPVWPQDTDWPFSTTGKPLKYISRKRDGDLVKFIFQDVDTGELKEIEDFY